ncbi:D-3-phosphoglycerate dehydrogenase [Poriferisphaera corsica]|uniref:D-3-phosphoglycerate dehydrogenase n=1 Tax=Poriferisphaera corsica TaxID=2528020 RepID=A0A517YQP1_9BACT|nr:phosphoglycerate dehydrogenase [Poriferisphaera corsica]QDU32530.1 D-3-phosphoglycerate dehydrogenase [Poriferisphaera corsica]
MSTFRILAADKLAQEGLDYITKQDDCELVNKPGLTEEEYAELIQDCDAMIVRSGIKVTAKILENPGKLKVIARAGVGVDNIDLAAATEKGILVVNTAAASTITTAEHAFALMMSLMRNIGPAYKGMTEGKWDRNKYTGRQLMGKTLGVVGFGRIGQTMAERALAFGMDVVAYDPFINAETMMDGRVKMFNNFEDILPLIDIISFHVPLNDATRGILSAKTYPKCKDGLYVVNAARGGVVDEADLLEALDSGKVAAAAMDVFTSEPPTADDPLRNHPRVLITPHLGASTKEAQQAVSVDAADNCMTYLRGEGIVGAVNAGNLKINLSPVQEKYVDLSNRMAKLLSPMITRGIAEVTIELAGKSLAAGLSMIERTALVGLFEHHLTDPVNIINVNQVAEARGIKVKTVTTDDDKATGLTIEVTGPAGAVDDETNADDKTRRIVGRVYDDLKPRIVEINGYHMDMIPEGPMILLLNEDKPGMIGLVGSTFGSENVNIADMTISRRGNTAMMVFKVDSEPTTAQLETIKTKEGILKTASVQLAEA